MIRTPTTRVTGDALAPLRRLTGRDRLLLSWLAEHYVLTTDQIAAALFPGLRAGQRRLTVLHRIGAVSRFAFARTDTQTGAYHYTLGPLGVLLHPTAYTDPGNPTARPPRSHLQRRARILASPRLDHLLGVNSFFTDLYAHTRRHPEARLERWWSEQHATAAWAAAGIRPDGHGIWRVDQHVVGFFLEHDTGSEPLTRVVAKLRAYERLALLGPRYPCCCGCPRRAANSGCCTCWRGFPRRCPWPPPCTTAPRPVRCGRCPTPPTAAWPCTSCPPAPPAATPSPPAPTPRSTTTSRQRTVFLTASAHTRRVEPDRPGEHPGTRRRPASGAASRAHDTLLDPALDRHSARKWALAVAGLSVAVVGLW